MPRKLLASQQAGLAAIVVLLGAVLTAFAGSHVDRLTGQPVNNFLNSHTLIQVGTDASFFAIMAVGGTIGIISVGYDLSVGSIYPLPGLPSPVLLRSAAPAAPLAVPDVVVLVCGSLNGLMVVGHRVHHFIITLETMWILRGIAFVSSNAESILVPRPLTDLAKASLGLASSLYPVPILTMIAVTTAGAVYLTRTGMGRHVFAIGWAAEAGRRFG